VPAQDLPPSARRYALAQRRESAAAVSAVRRLWGQMTPDFDASYLRIEQMLVAVVMTAQRRMADAALEYVPDVLADTGQDAAVRAAVRPVVGPLIGVDGSGRPVPSLLYGAVTNAKSVVGSGSSPAFALRRSGALLKLMTTTTLSDTARQAESLGIGVRPVTGYVRMLVPPSCSRCVVLAGKRVKSETAFQRHPGCDCRHIPASESVAGDLLVDPARYFEQLTTEQQDATFGKAGADAIRAGADPGQVVNARRGMSAAGETTTTSREMWVRKPDGTLTFENRVVNVTTRRAAPVTVGGRDVLVTSEGMTRRGQTYRRVTEQHGAAQDTKRPRPRYSRPSVPRPMPETIAQVAVDKADYLRLLHTYGYVL
jgi:hypothetical protein